MEDTLLNLINSGPTGVVCAAIVYLIITIQRNTTSNRRDKDKEEMSKEIALLKQRIDKVDELDLATKLAQIQTDLNWIKDKMQEN